MYTARILKQAANELEELEKPIGRRLIKRIGRQTEFLVE